MIIDSAGSCSFHDGVACTSGVIGAVGLGGVVVGLAIKPDARWIEPVGALAHLALMPFTAANPTPRWGRALGYGWLVAEAAISIAKVSGVQAKSAMTARLIGHVAAAAWIASAASRADTHPRRWLGWSLALALGGHSLVAPRKKPPVLLIASGPLMVAWLLVSSTRRTRRQPT